MGNICVPKTNYGYFATEPWSARHAHVEGHTIRAKLMTAIRYTHTHAHMGIRSGFGAW